MQLASTLRPQCPLWVKSGQTVPRQNVALSAIVQKRTLATAMFQMEQLNQLHRIPKRVF